MPLTTAPGRRSLRLKHLSFLCMSLLVSHSSAADGQSANHIYSAPGSGPLIQNKGHDSTPPAQPGKRVSLDVSDSSLRYITFEIARQSGLRVVGYEAGPLTDSKASIRISNATAEEAFREALKGTGLVAIISYANGTVLLKADNVDKRDTRKATGVIAGRVTDSASKNGLANVTVSVVGSRSSAVTDESGSYRITGVDPGQVSIALRLLGYRTITASVLVRDDQPAYLNLSMAPAATTLGEVVTTATGAQRRVEIPNDIARINPEVIMERTPVRNVTDLLEAAQVPGVLVTRASGDPGAGTRIRIRGIGSISQSNDPVVIIDGVWMNASGDAATRINDIDPATIENIEIVRGPSASTLYGQDASNGVIVITTKKGVSGTTRWNLSFDRDWGSVRQQRPPVFVGWGISLNEERVVTCNVEDVLAFRCSFDSVHVYNPDHPLLQKEGTALTDRVALSVDGGVGGITYSITGTAQNELGATRPSPVSVIRRRLLGYVQSESALKPRSLSRRSISSSFFMSPRDNLTFTLSLNGNNRNLRNNTFAGGFGVPESNASLEVRELSLDTVAFLNSSNNNIIYQQNPERSTGLVLGLQSNWRPYGAWHLSSTTGIERVTEHRSTQGRATRCRVDTGCQDTTGTRSENRMERDVYTVRLNASTVLNTGRLNRFLQLRPAFGADYRLNKNSGISVSVNGIPPGESAMSGGDLLNINTPKYENATAGWYLNTTVGLFDRVYFDVGVRQDIGSAITSSSNTTYPKLGASWLISDEDFWPRNNLVGLLRLRGALGHAAVQPDITDVRGRYVSDFVYTEGGFQRSIRFERSGNPALAPERATEVEVGFETDVLYDRLNLVFTYARKENRNTLVNRNTAPSSGIITPRKENIARVRNSVIEMAATGRVIENRNMLLLFDYALTMTENQVTRLGSGVSPFTIFDESRIEEGYPIAGIWSQVVLGYRDIDGNALLSPNEIVLSDSVAYLGWSQPRYKASYGMSLNLRGQITLDTRFSYRSQYVLHVPPVSQRSLEDANSPLPEQAVAKVQVLRGSRPASDIRWNSASITYHLPAHLLSRINARSLSVALQGRDLGVWTNFAGRDPGVGGAFGAGNEVAQYNNQATPLPRFFTLAFKWGL